MEVKKYTVHPSFWQLLAIYIIIWAYIIVAFQVSGKTIKDSTDIILVVLISLLLLFYLVRLIQCGLAWHSYMEISEEGVQMKGCAKRIPVNKNEDVDDILIPWGDIDEIKGWLDYPVLVLKTGEIIKLTHEININGRTVQKAFEQYKSIQRQKELERLENDPEQSSDGVISVISVINDKDTI